MIVVLGLFLVAADPDGAVGLGQRLDRPGQPVLLRTSASSAPTTTRPLLTEPGLSRQDFMISLRNTFYYVIGVVPLQTVLALLLAVIVNQRFLKGRTFFRTAFYFPSVVSSVAISLIFLFLFTGTGAVNQFLGVFGIDGPDLVLRLPRRAPPPRGRPRTVEHRAPAGGPGRHTTSSGSRWWEWLAGPERGDDARSCCRSSGPRPARSC